MSECSLTHTVSMSPRAPAMAPDDRRASIIAATIPLLRDKGRGISTQEIAKAAGIAEGTIFRVFDSKDEIIHACVHEAFDTAAVRPSWRRSTATCRCATASPPRSPSCRSTCRASSR